MWRGLTDVYVCHSHGREESAAVAVENHGWYIISLTCVVLVKNTQGQNLGLAWQMATLKVDVNTNQSIYDSNRHTKKAEGSRTTSLESRLFGLVARFVNRASLMVT